MNKFLLIQDFIIGICIGSFLNVVIYRLPNNFSIIYPRSFCPKCENQILWYSNIPILSWLLQNGKCRKCKKEISIKYPIIELLTGIIFVIFRYASPNYYSGELMNFIELLFTWIFLSNLIAISFIDIDSFWVPQSLINFGFTFGLLNLIYVEIIDIEMIPAEIFLKGFSGGISAFITFELLRKFSRFVFRKDALGKGDVKLVSMIGIWLGPIGVFLGIAISYVFAAFCILIGFQIGKISRNQIIPFAPFLSIGAFIVWFFGNDFLLNIIF